MDPNVEDSLMRRSVLLVLFATFLAAGCDGMTEPRMPNPEDGDDEPPDSETGATPRTALAPPITFSGSQLL
jgi:hypothetical protein